VSKSGGLNDPVLITGVTGFIGREIVAGFSRAGVPVVGVSRRDVSGASFPIHVSAYEIDHLADIIAEVRPAVLIHAAGTASVGESFDNPDHDFTSSLVLFQHVLEGVRRSGVQPRVVFFSSAAVYGNPDVLPVSECAPLNPISPYGFHKVMGEQLAREYTDCFHIPTLVVRLFSLFGPKQKRLLLWELFEHYRDSPEVVLQGSGEETRDYLYIDDFVDTLLRLLPKLESAHQVLNVASGKEIKVRDVALGIGRILRSDKSLVCLGKTRNGDPNRWQADIRLLQKITDDWEPVAFESRLEWNIEQWRK